MKKRMLFGIGLILGFMNVSALALVPSGMAKVKLNDVVYQVHLKGFASTATANVTIQVNATVNNNRLGQTQQQIMEKLKKIAPKADWHILDFNRSQDSAGLETLRMTASARLAQTTLNALRDRVKAASKTGLKFELQNIDFQPNAMEYEKERAALREQVYQQVNVELVRLNKQYPAQHFFVHRIDFLGLTTERGGMMRQGGMGANANFVKMAPKTQSPTVGRVVYATATVVLSSTVK